MSIEYGFHPTTEQIKLLCGYRPNEEATKKILQSNNRKIFSDAAPHLKNYWQGEDIGLWEAAKKVNGQFLPADKQTIGDCESHGNGRAVDYLYCIKQSIGAASGFVEGQTSCMTEALYGEGREVGNMLGNEDGCYGSAMIEALQKFGFVGRNGTPYSGSTAKSYGRTGTPQALKDAGRIHICTGYAQLKTTDDMANALKAGCPCPISSDQGFTMTRDSNGVCSPQGQWGHCMCVIGLFMIGGSRYFVILQSWGQMCPDGPVPYQGPDNSFGCDEQTMQNIIGQNDSYALSALAGFEPAPSVDWIM